MIGSRLRSVATIPPKDASFIDSVIAVAAAPPPPSLSYAREVFGKMTQPQWFLLFEPFTGLLVLPLKVGLMGM